MKFYSKFLFSSKNCVHQLIKEKLVELISTLLLQRLTIFYQFRCSSFKRLITLKNKTINKQNCGFSSKQTNSKLINE